MITQANEKCSLILSAMACASILIFSTLAGANTPCGCREYLDNNEYDSARICLQKALAKKPSDYLLQLENAELTVNAAAAKNMYKKLLGAPSCPDSIRAQALYRLACCAYISANYSKAEHYCKNAWTIDKRPLYTDYYARCASLNKHDSLSLTLKRDVLADDASAQTRDTFQGKAKEEDAAPKQVYYLQAGAFGDMENAQALREELKKFCSKVVVVAAISNDKNIYRVRVGAFESKEAAQAFGDSALAKRKMPFRIVEE
jgi:hypothetical protein